MSETLYPAEDWLNDFEWFRSTVAPEMHMRDAAQNTSLFVEHFRSLRIPNPQFRLDRFYAAAHYLSRNLHFFDTGRIAIVGSSHHSISHALQLALWAAFVQSEPQEDPDPQFVLELAERAQSRMQAAKEKKDEPA